MMPGWPENLLHRIRDSFAFQHLLGHLRYTLITFVRKAARLVRLKHDSLDDYSNTTDLVQARHICSHICAFLCRALVSGNSA